MLKRGFVVVALAILFTAPISGGSKEGAVLPAPSEGKAIVCIYRVGRFTGSASHDELYVNGTHLAKLGGSQRDEQTASLGGAGGEGGGEAGIR